MQFKRALKVPVICATQGCYDPLLWEEALKKGQTDVIQIAKPFLADSELPRKILEEKSTEIRPCVYASTALTQKKARSPTAPSTRKPAARRVCHQISGSTQKGPCSGRGSGRIGGCPDCRVRGHAVTLAEKGRALGGNF